MMFGRGRYDQRCNKTKTMSSSTIHFVTLGFKAEDHTAVVTVSHSSPKAILTLYEVGTQLVPSVVRTALSTLDEREPSLLLISRKVAVVDTSYDSLAFDRSSEAYEVRNGQNESEFTLCQCRKQARLKRPDRQISCGISASHVLLR